jgi:hypothetical protein
MLVKSLLVFRSQVKIIFSNKLTVNESLAG